VAKDRLFVFSKANLGISLSQLERRSGPKRTWETNADVCCVSVFVLQARQGKSWDSPRTMADLVDQGRDSLLEEEGKEGEGEGEGEGMREARFRFSRIPSSSCRSAPSDCPCAASWTRLAAGRTGRDRTTQ
jgi:hypothetical protein